MPGNKAIRELLPWVAAVAGGTLLFLGYAGFDRYYLEWVCLVPVLWAVRDKSPGRAFFIGWIAGIAAHAGGFYWAIGMFRHFAGLPWPLATLGLLLLAAANGTIVAAWAWGTRLITRDTGWNVIWVAPVVWTALETFWPEIFPNYLGASQYLLSPLTQVAEVTGILGVSFLVVYLNCTVYAAAACWFENRRLPWRALAACAAVFTLVLAYGEFRIRALDRQISTAQKLTVGLVQTNRGAGDKRSDPVSLLREHQEMSEALARTRPLDLIVWPESVCRLIMASREGQLPSGLLGASTTPILFGAVLQLEGDGVRTFNSALLADATGRILGTYDKSVLVPFGEYIPFGEIFPSLYSLAPYTSRFSPGESEEPLLLGGHPLAVSICYEDIFPGKIRALMRGGGERRIPEAIFNLTNDSWYGKTTEPMEHLVLASFRGIEQRRSLVRVTNTGVSAFVDPVGRIVRRTGVWTKESLVDRIPLLQGGTLYSLWGDWLGWSCAILSAFGMVRALRVSRFRKESDRPCERAGTRQSKRSQARKPPPRRR